MNKTSFLKLLELLPAVAFGVVYFFYGRDLISATIALIVAHTVFVMATVALREPLKKIHVISWFVIVVFGGATILFRDELFIKWKPTAFNSLLAVAFFLSHFLGEKTLTERFLGKYVNAPAAMLRKVNMSAIVYFLLVAVLNIVVAYQFSNDVWVKFKLVGLLVFNMAYIMGCAFYLREYLNTDEAAGKINS